MAENDANHQRDIEKSALILASEESKRGQRYGLTIAIFVFLTCIVALLLGSEKTAMTLGGTTVISLVAAFVAGRAKQAK